MPIGDMNNKIKIIALETDTTKRYPTDPIETVVRECWAEVEHEGMRDYQTAIQNKTVNELSFKIRKSKTPIDNKMKVIFGDKHLKITTVFDDYKDKKKMKIITEGID